jgi:UDP-N-acetylmuramoyl-tripeptide--D-alanyl-D-alanine ligase
MTELTWPTWAASAACWLSLAPSGARWLRVAQREHYLAGSTVRFARRWWLSVGINVPIALLSLVGAGLSWPFPAVALVAALAASVGPIGLSPRGRTSPLAWTRRLRTLAAAWASAEAIVVVVGFLLHRPAFFSALGVILAPALMDVACLATSPIERQLASRFVERAAARIRSVRPIIVGITGSYGKTSTKNYVAHLLAPGLRVVASPASFNNRAGLARAVNEHLAEGTEVFVAEMGTYGHGEIAELCRWCPPDIAVITAIGPVHLERFGSEDEIVRAKSEIAERAATVVLNVDDPRLAALGDRLRNRVDPPVVIRCSGLDRQADVCVLESDGGLEVLLAGEPIARDLTVPSGVQTTNVACAIGVAQRLGVPTSDLVERLRRLPAVPHRLSIGTAPSGVVVIDDTFNSNPAGARAALRVLADAGRSGRRVLVTPGMVELGRRQAEENEAFARASAEVATELLVVGRTNRSALVAGRGEGAWRVVRRREEAVEWVRAHLLDGDAVLYENDLPDHYP